jgi:hypothetical protein
VDLVQWLTAQLDADERIARGAGGDSWRRQDHPSETVAVYDSKGEPVVYDEGWPTEEQQTHIARHDPARVLREIDSKRRIVDAHERRPMSSGETADCAQCWGAVWPCPTLRLLALPYEARPGYRPEWRP